MNRPDAECVVMDIWWRLHAARKDHLCDYRPGTGGPVKLTTRLPVLREELHKVQGRCNQRTLHEDEVQTFVREVQAAIRWAKKRNLPEVRARLRGGDVPSSYRYDATSTNVTVEWRQGDAVAEMTIERARARRRRGGREELIRIRNPGHTTKTRWYSHAGWTYFKKKA